ncbi:MAG TPA: hypothetical protein DD391_00435 [Clostridiales bacterium]|nr:AraC family transcriptional regulator [Clostridiales bacterium]HBL81076.1 hypothetical protein [Clostridiales bacterium]
MNKDYCITEFISALNVHDEEGKLLTMKNRYSASLVFPLSGAISFSAGKNRVIADNNHPVYIPQGINYFNRCLREADSILFNFYDMNGFGELTSLPPVPTETVLECFERIKTPAEAVQTSRFYILSQLYSLLHKLENNEMQNKNPILVSAALFIKQNFHVTGLSLTDIANAACVSKVYLGKVFVKELQITPFQYLTKIRMEQAVTYLQEFRRVGEVSASVGYGDVYQFSRAFKKYYGCSPKAYCRRLL